MMEMRSRVTLVGIGLVAALAAGCTPTTQPTAAPTATDTDVPASTSAPSTSSPASPTPTSPTPSSTLNPNQVAAARTVSDYLVAAMKVGHDPQGFSRSQMKATFSRYLNAGIAQAHVDRFMEMKKDGQRWEGDIVARSIKVSKVSDRDVALEAKVTVCQDQTTLRTVDKNGDPVTGQTAVPFNLRQYTVRKYAGSKWLVYGMETVKGECGS